MQANQNLDTIVAPATPPGEGGIGILRLSGPRAAEILQSFFRPSRGSGPLASHRLYHGRLITRQGICADEVMAVVMRAPRSYTREDVAEIHCHGGPQVMRRLLDLFIESGIRLARPGEFTLRAFLNGRLDLAQAEAVIAVIRSASEAASQVALQQLAGKLSQAIHTIRDQLVEVLALIETEVDFPEDELELPSRQALQERVEVARGEIDQLLASFDTGRTLREGMAVLILGKPNVGKSSLLNALLGEARAIVNPAPGTTRDTIEENLNLGGIPLRLVDTAGIRHTTDPIEAEGVRRARAKIPSADLVLLVVDGSQAPDGD
ncbi:MAG: tRNA uridine-5-carboxymethylaminomethyl(34) synthesis GTPase MnmE, partial [Desulfuromonadales bacterium]|nr:tRNA uridine-5-carboxymethylaminomethyl(34) synthesis GTPase MnmE [Desulfuromonadales bacterium]